MCLCLTAAGGHWWLTPSLFPQSRHAGDAGFAAERTLASTTENAMLCQKVSCCQKCLLLYLESVLKTSSVTDCIYYNARWISSVGDTYPILAYMQFKICIFVPEFHDYMKWNCCESCLNTYMREISSLCPSLRGLTPSAGFSCGIGWQSGHISRMQHVESSRMETGWRWRQWADQQSGVYVPLLPSSLACHRHLIILQVPEGEMGNASDSRPAP